MHGRCSKRRRSTRQRSGRCFDCCSRPLCLHRASTRPAIPRASWTVERLIDRSDVETTAPEGKREYAGAVEASCAATEPSRHPVPIDLSTPWTGLRSFFLLAFKARARDFPSFARVRLRVLFRVCPHRPTAVIPHTRSRSVVLVRVKSEEVKEKNRKEEKNLVVMFYEKCNPKVIALFFDFLSLVSRRRPPSGGFFLKC